MIDIGILKESAYEVLDDFHRSESFDFLIFLLLCIKYIIIGITPICLAAILDIEAFLLLYITYPIIFVCIKIRKKYRIVDERYRND